MPKTTTQVARATRGSPRKDPSNMLCRQCQDLPLRSQCPHSHEGRLFLEEIGTAAQVLQNGSEKAKRAPQKCSRCLHRPLRSQCEHTVSGRAYLQRKAIEVEVASQMSTPQLISTTTPTPTASSQTSTSQLILTTSPTPTPQLISTTGPTPMSRLIPIMSPTLTTLSTANESREVPIDPILLRLSPQDMFNTDPVFPRTPSRISTWPNQVATAGTASGLISTNRSEDTSNSADTSSPSPSSMFLPSPITVSDGVTSPSSVSSFPPLPKPRTTKTKYERATKRNPIYKHVKGVMRGTDEHVVVRHHPRPLPLPDSKAGSAAFLRRINRLTERAEDIYAETGCWLFIAAQHPAAQGPTIHYTTPRLRRDAPKEMDDITNDYHQLMTSLLQSRRTDALEIAKECQKAKEDSVRMASRVQSLEAQLGDMRNALEAYSAQLGLTSS